VAELVVCDCFQVSIHELAEEPNQPYVLVMKGLCICNIYNYKQLFSALTLLFGTGRASDLSTIGDGVHALRAGVVICLV